LDGQKIAEVFVNVFENAMHAMAQGGTLIVRTYTQTFVGVGSNVGASKIDRFKIGDPLVVVEVEATGTGIPPDKLNKIFEPFFTTKKTGEGTGLGLSVCKTIMDLHGGAIEIVNRDKGGARATITFRAEVETANPVVR
jgi:signal transduction histidine kinase